MPSVTNICSSWDSTTKSKIAHIMTLIVIFFIGVMAYALAIVLGITSLPSVTNVLTWKEFGFVQSKLGWICLLFACAHDMFYGWPYIGSPSCKVPPTFQVCIFPSSIYSWFLKPLSVLHSRFPTKKSWVVAYFFNFFPLFQKKNIYIYRTRAIITRGLYIFYPILASAVKSYI